MKKAFLLLVLLISILLVGCGGEPSEPALYDITGTWTYTLLSSEGNTYDAGTITFTGKPESGTFTEINLYDIEYEGEYTVNGAAVTVTNGETWEGTFTDSDHIEGDWENEEASGTFTLVRE